MTVALRKMEIQRNGNKKHGVVRFTEVIIMSVNNNQKSAGYAMLGVIIVFAIIGFLVSLTEKKIRSVHLQDAITRYRRRAVTAISTTHPESAERLLMEQAARTVILQQAAVPHQIVREVVRIPVHRLAVTSQAVRTASITAVIRMILTIAATMMSTWMAIMIRTGTTGMMIMQPVWMMPSRKISRMETMGTGKGSIWEFLISGTETQKMV